MCNSSALEEFVRISNRSVSHHVQQTLCSSPKTWLNHTIHTHTHTHTHTHSLLPCLNQLRSDSKPSGSPLSSLCPLCGTVCILLCGPSRPSVYPPHPHD